MSIKQSEYTAPVGIGQRRVTYEHAAALYRVQRWFSGYRPNSGLSAFLDQVNEDLGKVSIADLEGLEVAVTFADFLEVNRANLQVYEVIAI